jgi:hypothetical protein
MKESTEKKAHAELDAVLVILYTRSAMIRIKTMLNPTIVLMCVPKTEKSKAFR